jgi:hypothetical protein
VNEHHIFTLGLFLIGKITNSIIYSIYLFVYLFISPPYKYIIIFDGNKDLDHIFDTLADRYRLSGGSASGVVDWANLFRVVSSFHDSGIASSLR